MAKEKQQTDSADYPPAFLEGLRLYWQGCYWHSTRRGRNFGGKRTNLSEVS
jgi:hypothetical protein